MARFAIKGDVPGLTGDVTPKGGTLVNDIFTTEDRPWIKALRNLPDSIAEEILEDDPDDE